MKRFQRLIHQGVAALVRRDPGIRFGGAPDRDWLPPVLGPTDWPQGLMAGMADGGATWYFDRH